MFYHSILYTFWGAPQGIIESHQVRGGLKRRMHSSKEIVMENSNQSSFILFKTEDEQISVDVRFEDETV